MKALGNVRQDLKLIPFQVLSVLQLPKVWPHGFGPIQLPKWCVQVCNLSGSALHGVWGWEGGMEGRAGRGDLRILRMGKGTGLELRVQFPAGDKVFTPDPDDLLAVALHVAVDAGQGRLLLQLGHPGGVRVRGRARAVAPARLAARDGGRLQPLPKVSVSHSTSHGLAVLIVIAEDVRFLDVLLLFILSKVKLFLYPAVSVPTVRGLLGLFFRAARVDGI